MYQWKPITLAFVAGDRRLAFWDDTDVSEGPGGGWNVAEGQVGTGFKAIAAGDWRGARDAFSAVLEVAEVPEAFFGLANALFWLGDLAGTISSCEKAYAGFRRRGDTMFAAGAALSLVGYNKRYLGSTATRRLKLATNVRKPAAEDRWAVNPSVQELGGGKN